MTSRRKPGAGYPWRVDSSTAAPPARRLAARWIGSVPVRVWGLSPPERLRRSLVRAGVWDMGAWTGAPPQGGRALLLLRGDHVYDHALVAALVKSPGTVLEDGSGRAVAANVDSGRAPAVAEALAAGGPLPEGLARTRPDTLVPPHRVPLRKRETPVVLPVTEATRRAVEDRLFGASYKGVTDLVTKYVWPLPAKQATRLCAEAGLSPNTVTSASAVLAVAALLLLAQGWLWTGLVAAWAMTFLDTVDGKLARVTLNSSQLGDALDHGLDLIHPPFWWWAWWAGAGGDGDALLVVVVGYVILRLQEGMFLKVFGMEMHVWRPFDSRFRLVTARRNPILILLTLSLLLGVPDHGIRWVAAWTLVSVVVHGARILMALRAREAGGPLRSWLDEP